MNALEKMFHRFVIAFEYAHDNEFEEFMNSGIDSIDVLEKNNKENFQTFKIIGTYSTASEKFSVRDKSATINDFSSLIIHLKDGTSISSMIASFLPWIFDDDPIDGWEIWDVDPDWGY